MRKQDKGWKIIALKKCGIMWKRFLYYVVGKINCVLCYNRA